jgi:hypothetical protein
VYFCHKKILFSLFLGIVYLPVATVCMQTSIQVPILPVELWEHIFSFLPADTLFLNEFIRTLPAESISNTLYIRIAQAYLQSHFVPNSELETAIQNNFSTCLGTQEQRTNFKNRFACAINSNNSYDEKLFCRIKKELLLSNYLAIDTLFIEELYHDRTVLQDPDNILRLEEFKAVTFLHKVEQLIECKKYKNTLAKQKAIFNCFLALFPDVSTLLQSDYLDKIDQSVKIFLTMSALVLFSVYINYRAGGDSLSVVIENKSAVILFFTFTIGSILHLLVRPYSRNVNQEKDPILLGFIDSITYYKNRVGERQKHFNSLEAQMKLVLFE